jgi:HEAT repeat protein
LKTALVSDPLLGMVLYAAIGVIVLSFVMLLAVIGLRVALLLRRRREQRFIATWRPLMVECVERVPETVPAVAAADRVTFLRLWNHYQESLRGVAGERLNALAAASGMDAVARKMLGMRSLRDRLIAAVTLGHVGDPGANEALRRLAGDESPLLSIAAAHALMRIDPAGAVAEIVAASARRADWPIARVAAILAEAGVEIVTPALAAALDKSFEGEGAVERARRLLHLADVSYAEHLGPAVRRVAELATDHGLLADCLNALRDPHDVDLARRHALHESWIVRVAAAKALGRIGEPGDRERLIAMLGDPHWWVRYRAGGALAALPSVSPADLERIRAALSDRFAAEMLRHVIAERA